MGKKNTDISYIKKLLVLGVAAVAIGVFIKSLVNYYMESMKKISAITGDSKEYTATFESKEIKPGCSFKGGGIRSMFSGVTLRIDDLKMSEDISITCNAIASGIEIIVPDNINVVTIDVSKLSAVQNNALKPFDANQKTLKVYISGFMSGIMIKSV